jgi:hypothetical protein
MNFPAETRPDTMRVVFVNTTAIKNKEKKMSETMQRFGSGSNCPAKFKRNSTA